ncbi:MAG: TonB-dependent receptor plug domain-containing protein, partial [Xanthomonadales bacterium]|nr:TonB-dependent receptor plug domain-containing protein [Xanthomonadales bacterium]
MSYIKSRKHPCLLHGTSAFALLTTLALSVPPAQAGAVDDAAWRKPKKNAVELDEVKVEAHGVYPAAELSSPKFTQPIQDTPQTIQVIDRALFTQQGATTLTEALRNSAGVGTFYAGENGSTSTGDAVSMRGFDSSGSLFVDGVRDLGSIARDVFNIEQIEVVKGPAGTDNGRTAPTGAINLVSKQAQLREATSASLAFGADGQRRASVDLNQLLGEASALRINAMWQDSDVAGRDRVNNSRRGIAPSLVWGIGGDT